MAGTCVLLMWQRLQRVWAVQGQHMVAGHVISVVAERLYRSGNCTGY
jgi:hypothetical protein